MAITCFIFNLYLFEENQLAVACNKHALNIFMLIYNSQLVLRETKYKVDGKNISQRAEGYGCKQFAANSV